MRKFIFAVSAIAALTACTSTAKRYTTEATVYSYNNLPTPEDRLDLMVSGYTLLPRNVVPKTTDLGSVRITKPILSVLMYRGGENVEAPKQ